MVEYGVCSSMFYDVLKINVKSTLINDLSSVFLTLDLYIKKAKCLWAYALLQGVHIVHSVTQISLQSCSRENLILWS